LGDRAADDWTVVGHYDVFVTIARRSGSAALRETSIFWIGPDPVVISLHGTKPINNLRIVGGMFRKIPAVVKITAAGGRIKSECRRTAGLSATHLALLLGATRLRAEYIRDVGGAG
jgi:hypothetical protein